MTIKLNYTVIYIIVLVGGFFACAQSGALKKPKPPPKQPTPEQIAFANCVLPLNEEIGARPEEATLEQTLSYRRLVEQTCAKLPECYGDTFPKDYIDSEIIRCIENVDELGWIPI